MNEQTHIVATILLFLWHNYLQHQLHTRLVQIRQMNVLVVQTFYHGQQERKRRLQVDFLLCHQTIN